MKSIKMLIILFAIFSFDFSISKENSPQVDFVKINWLKLNKQVIQEFSYRLNHIAISVLFDSSNPRISDVALSITKACKTGNSVSFVTIKEKKYNVGWEKIENISSFKCSVKPEGKYNFTVTISGNPGDGHIWYSVNGNPPRLRASL
jgi:hypothetical protein